MFSVFSGLRCVKAILKFRAFPGKLPALPDSGRSIFSKPLCVWPLTLLLQSLVPRCIEKGHGQVGENRETGLSFTGLVLVVGGHGFQLFGFVLLRRFFSSQEIARKAVVLLVFHFPVAYRRYRRQQLPHHLPNRYRNISLSRRALCENHLRPC